MKRDTKWDTEGEEKKELKERKGEKRTKRRHGREKKKITMNTKKGGKEQGAGEGKRRKESEQQRK